MSHEPFFNKLHDVHFIHCYRSQVLGHKTKGDDCHLIRFKADDTFKHKSLILSLAISPSNLPILLYIQSHSMFVFVFVDDFLLIFLKTYFWSRPNLRLLSISLLQFIAFSFGTVCGSWTLVLLRLWSSSVALEHKACDRLVGSPTLWKMLCWLCWLWHWGLWDACCFCLLS